MPRLDIFAPAFAGGSLTSETDLFSDHLEARAENRLVKDRPHAGPPPARIIEIGEIAAGIAVPEHGGVRFFSSTREVDILDGTMFRSVEQAAKAARARFQNRARTDRRRDAPAQRLLEAV